jgi:hypothetical protein
MQTFKEYYLLTESTKYGCLMAYLPKEEWKEFTSFAKEHIDKEN